MLQIKDVMTPQAEVISPDTTTEDAASLMKTLDIGVLPVCDAEGLVGILTDRDLVVRVLAAARDPKAMLVGEAMTPSVVYCFEDDDVEHAAAIMAGQQIRRLPVLDKTRRLVGIVSVGDIAVHDQDHHLTGKVLEDVSQPSAPRRGDTTDQGDGVGQAA
jgi:CBS domain-containing protein